MNKAFDLIIIYKIIKLLISPWKKWDAYKLGIINDKGEKIKEPQTKKEKDIWTPFVRLVWRIKKLIHKLGGNNNLSSLLATYLLIKESKEFQELCELYNIDEDDFKDYLTEMTVTSDIAMFDKPIDTKILKRSNEIVLTKTEFEKVKKNKKFLQVFKKGTILVNKETGEKIEV